MNPTSLNITHCPNCGSDQIKKVCRNWTASFQGQPYVVPELTFYECPVCGERVFDHAAMKKIQAYSPAYTSRPHKLIRPRVAKASVS